MRREGDLVIGLVSAIFRGAAQVLLNIADNMELRTYRDLDLFVKLLEPMMLLVMGVVILFIMVALLLTLIGLLRAKMPASDANP